MTIKKDLKVITIVILADENSPITPAELNQFWLKNNLLSKVEDIRADSVFSPELLFLNSALFNLTIDKGKIQFMARDYQSVKDILNTFFIPSIQALSVRNLRAMGMNFNWYLESQEGAKELSKRLFWSDTPLIKAFESENTKYGTYLSKDLDHNVRLKLDIKPVVLNLDNTITDCIQCVFNYHSELKDSSGTSKCIELLNRIERLKDNSTEIINSIN